MIKTKIIFCLSVLLIIIYSGCQNGPSSSDTVEVSVGTLNDEIVKFVVNLSNGKIDTASRKVISGDSTGIKLPVDLEINEGNKLFVLSQGNLYLPNGSIRPSVRIFRDDAEGNTPPEKVIDITDTPNFKPVGLAITRDFMYVSYFRDDTLSAISKIIRFDMNGNRLIFTIPARSLGDIEINKSNNMLVGVDAIGNQILRFSIRSNFEVQSGFDSILITEPNSIALTDSGNILVFEQWRSNFPTLNSFSFNSSGNTNPSNVIWGRCGTGKEFITPYGLAVLEEFGLKISAVCSGNRLIIFPLDANGCADPVQKVDINEPISVAFDKLKF